MEYAQLNEAGTEAIQVTTHGPVEWDANNYCSAAALVKDGKAEQFRVVPLEVIEPPAIDPATQTVYRDGCELVDGQWRYKWTVRDLTQEEIEANRKAAVPYEVTALSALAAIDEAGLAAAYTAWATSPARTFMERAFIDKALMWKRDNAALRAAADALGLGSEQMDAMFIRAKQLEAII